MANEPARTRVEPDRPAPAAHPLWAPTVEAVERSSFRRYLAWLADRRSLTLADYGEAWEWSCRAPADFWESLWQFFEIRATKPYDTVLVNRGMPDVQWFTGAQLNYAEHALRDTSAERTALLYASEQRPLAAMNRGELHRQVASVANALRGLGVQRGDRVAASLPNVPEAVIAFLAVASLGAIWSSCSPDFGVQGMADRFRQIEPRVLIAVDGYVYGGKSIDRRTQVGELMRALPTLQHTIIVPILDASARLPGTLSWQELLENDATLSFEAVPFDHPLWILYSSGATGLPKAIVHGHGGILLEHLKSLVLQNDMQPGGRFFWLTTAGWMMWNLLVSGLLADNVPVLYDGSPAWPDLTVLWKLAQDARVTRFGAGASYFTTCMKTNLQPGQRFDLSALHAIGSTGSPLPPEGFRWIYSAVKRDVWLASSSGGTDVCTAFLGGCPTLPVYEGELQGPALGVQACAFDDHGECVHGQTGELVITQPMPSMPLFFWNDPDKTQYRASYFARYPGVWHHGDRVRFTATGAIIEGRSDATLNRQGVRIGSSEIYRAVEALPEIADSLVVGLERPQGEYYMPLFVVLQPGLALDDALRTRINTGIRAAFTARHVPDVIIQVPSLPRTINGKKLEVPVKRILQGESPAQVLQSAALDDAAALDFFVNLAMTLNGPRLEIRTARADERSAIRQLTERAYAQYQTIMTPSAWQALAQAVDGALDTEENAERIVALRAGQLVGSVMLYSAAADAYAGATALTEAPEVRLLAVAPEARGHGVARALMDECIRRARAAGAVELGLHTSASMQAAIQLYQDMGFVRVPARDFQPEGAERVTAYRLGLTD